MTERDDSRVPHGSAATLRVAVARIYRALRQMAPSDITPSQVSVLFRISQHEPVRMGALAHYERITPATLCKIVDSLESLDLVERVADPQDGRVTLARVAPRGRELTTVQRESTTLAIENALTQLSDDERAALASALPALEALANVLFAEDEPTASTSG